MGFISIDLHVTLAHSSSAHQEALPCDSVAESSEDEDLLRPTSAEEEAELLCKYGLRFSDAASVGPSVMTTDPVISKLDELKAARSSSQVIVQSHATEDKVSQELNSAKIIRGTIPHLDF